MYLTSFQKNLSHNSSPHMLCDVDPGIAFHRLECLNSICENKCKLKSENILVLDGTK